MFKCSIVQVFGRSSSIVQVLCLTVPFALKRSRLIWLHSAAGVNAQANEELESNLCHSKRYAVQN